jgi:CHAT domain-containing protein
LARIKGGAETTAQIDQLFADLPRTSKPFQHPYYWGGFVMFGR